MTDKKQLRKELITKRKKMTDKFRLLCRKMLPPPNERTLSACIIPPSTSHNSGCYSVTFKDNKELLSVSASLVSLPFDFFVKTTSKTNFT